MKKLFSIMFMAVAMLTFSISTSAQAPTKKQRISREQLAVKQAQHIAYDLALDEKTKSQFIEQQLKQRFEMSEKVLNIRQKYYKKYSQFLTQNQIQRVYEIERQMMKRFAQKGKLNGGKPGARRAPRGGNM